MCTMRVFVYFPTHAFKTIRLKYHPLSVALLRNTLATEWNSCQYVSILLFLPILSLYVINILDSFIFDSVDSIYSCKSLSLVGIQ